ncbi:MAG: hypothetical protein ACTSR8_06520 [Promethearchaeota archaeon]
MKNIQIKKESISSELAMDNFFDVTSLPAIDKKYTRLEPINKIHSIEEGIQARVKDPIWLLGRQWQMGEFKAENGGAPVKTELSYITQPLNIIKKKTTDIPFELNEPLEAVVEDEKGTEKAWNPKRLEYSFTIKGKNVSLSADEYNGNELEWYNFNVENQETIDEEVVDLSIMPQRLSYRGMPHPRWWTFEDKNINVGNIQSPYLNYLTMLLMEFSLSYSNDWFIIPMEHKIGHLRKITRLNVIDSFGVVTELKPVVDPSQEKKGWEAFTISHKNPNKESDGSLFYIPNNLMGGGLEGDPIEEVSLMRDELANLVWAIEHTYQNIRGEVISRHDEEMENKEQQPKGTDEQIIYYWDTNADNINQAMVTRESIEDENDIGDRYLGPLAKYNLMSYVPPYWIPYVAKQLSSEKGEVILRRGTTNVNPTESSESSSKKAGRSKTLENTQYKGEFLKESTFIYEEEVPKSGVLLKRVWELARDLEGNYYNWLSKKKSQDMKRKSSGLRFDYLKSQK